MLGTLWALCISFMWGLYAVLLACGIEEQPYPTKRAVASVGYIVLGIAVIAVSKPLGRMIGKGLDG